MLKYQVRPGQRQASQRHVDTKIPKGSVSEKPAGREENRIVPKTDGPGEAWNSVLPEA